MSEIIMTECRYVDDLEQVQISPLYVSPFQLLKCSEKFSLLGSPKL